jgi:valyl-tRNA synthetase
VWVEAVGGGAGQVEYSEEQGSLFHFKYPIADSDGEFLPVATTRPETILGDTAVAVHPRDERYRHLIGRQCVVPTTDRCAPRRGSEKRTTRRNGAARCALGLPSG